MSRLSAALSAILPCAGPLTATAAPKSKLLGRYTCTVRQGAVDDAPQACSITFRRAKDGSGRTLWFSLLGDPQRLTGWVAPKEDGVEVDGAVACPKGQCAESAQMRFVAGLGGFDGQVETASGRQIAVKITSAGAR